MRTKLAILILSTTLCALALRAQFQPGQFPDALGQTPRTQEAVDSAEVETILSLPPEERLNAALSRLGQFDRALSNRRSENIDDLMLTALQELAQTQEIARSRTRNQSGVITEQQASSANELLNSCARHMDAAIRQASKSK